MLASTVQFSTYGQSLHIPHRQTPAQPGGTTSMEHSQKKQPRPPAGGRPVPSGPNSVPTTRPSAPPRSTPPHPKGHTGCTSGDHRQPAELVSVPPSSSTTNTRDPPQLAGLHGRRVALDRPPGTNPDMTGQCSLERR